MPKPTKDFDDIEMTKTDFKKRGEVTEAFKEKLTEQKLKSEANTNKVKIMPKPTQDFAKEPDGIEMTETNFKKRNEVTEALKDKPTEHKLKSEANINDDLKSKLDKFFDMYQQGKLSQDFNELANNYHEEIQKYYSQDGLARYQSVMSNPSNFNDKSEINTMVLYQKDASLQASVERFKQILAVQKSKDKLLKLDTKPINYEELHLIHSIKGVFGFEDSTFKEIEKSEQLMEAMKKKIEETEKLVEKQPENKERLVAMQELSDYYSAYIKDTSETQALNLPNNLKIKSITFDSPQQYSLSGKDESKKAGITSGTSFEMPEGLRLASPKKAMMHITFENGAELSVTPGPKPKLFLPNRNNFADGELGDNAYDASIKIFAEQYLAMRHGHLGDKIILEFNGLASQDKIYLREKFIDALLFQKAERKEGNKVVIDQEQVDIVRRATNGLFDDKTEAGVCEKFWQDYANKNTRSWSEYLSGSKRVDISRLQAHSDVKMKLILAKAVSLFQEKIAAPDNPNTYCHAIGEILRKPIDGIKYVFEAKEVTEAKKLAQAIECLAQEKLENNGESEKLVKKYLQAQHNGTEGIFEQFKHECQQSYKIANTTKSNFSRGP